MKSLSVSPPSHICTAILLAIARQQTSDSLTKGVQFYLFGGVITTVHSVEARADSHDRYYKVTVCLGLGLVLLCIRIPENCLRLNPDSNTDSVCQFTLQTDMCDHTHSFASFVGDFQGQPPETPEEWSLVSGGLVTNKTDWLHYMMEQNAVGALREWEQVLMEEPTMVTPRSDATPWTPPYVD